MKEYEVKVVEEKIVYVDAESEEQAIELAKTEAIHETPETIECEILSEIDEDDMDINICGERGCDGCLFQHRNDIALCRLEAKRKSEV